MLLVILHFSGHVYYLIEKLAAWTVEMCALFLPISIVVCFISSNSNFSDLGMLCPIFFLVVLHLCASLRVVVLCSGILIYVCVVRHVMCDF